MKTFYGFASVGSAVAGFIIAAAEPFAEK